MDTNEISLVVLKSEADLIRGDGVDRWFRWPEEFKEKVRLLHQEGVSAGDIAAETRIPIDSVRAWLGARKIRERRKRRFLEVPIKKAETRDVIVALEGGKRIEGLRLEDVRDLLLSGAL